MFWETLTAVVLLATAVVGFLKINRGVQEIHFMVNSHSEAQDARIEQLAAALMAAGVNVPDRPNDDGEEG